MDLRSLLGRGNLIIGESGSGKSTLLSRILYRLAESGYSEETTVIDMAPSLSWGVGGKISEIGDIPEGVRYYTSWEIAPPRLVGKTAEEVLKLARRNRSLLEPFVARFLASPTQVILVNDATIYAHAGSHGPLIEALRTASTWVATAYSGVRLADDRGASVTEAERRFVNSLLLIADRIIRMG